MLSLLGQHGLIQGWPTCDLCDKPVDRLESLTLIDAFEDGVVLVAHCHGEREEVRVDPMLVEQQRGGLHFGRAFVQRRQLKP